MSGKLMPGSSCEIQSSTRGPSPQKAAISLCSLLFGSGWSAAVLSAGREIGLP